MGATKTSEKKTENKAETPEYVSKPTYQRTVNRVKELEDRVAVLEEALAADLGVDLGQAAERVGARV